MPVSYPILRGFDPLSALVSIALASKAGVRSPCLGVVSTVVPYGLMRLYYWVHWRAIRKPVRPVSYTSLRGFDPLVTVVPYGSMRLYYWIH